MAYHSTLAFQIIDIAPRFTLEIAGTVVVMLISAMVNAQLFGEYAGLSEQRNKKSVEFQDQFDAANTAMAHLRLSDEEQSTVRDFLLKTTTVRTQQEEMQGFLSSVSPSNR